MTLFSSIFPFGCWLLFAGVAIFWERHRTSLSQAIGFHRRYWVANAIDREHPLDGILVANLMRSVSFFASTSVLVVLALFAVLGNLSKIDGVLAAAPLGVMHSASELELHLLITIFMFMVAFFAFTVSNRHFNHFNVLLGAIVGSNIEKDDLRLDTLARMNIKAARFFNSGVRLYYFSFSMIAWFIHDLLAIPVAIATLSFIIFQEFFSESRAALIALEKQENSA